MWGEIVVISHQSPRSHLFLDNLVKYMTLDGESEL